jgi:hypothetical protein
LTGCASETVVSELTASVSLASNVPSELMCNGMCYEGPISPGSRVRRMFCTNLGTITDGDYDPATPCRRVAQYWAENPGSSPSEVNLCYRYWQAYRCRRGDEKMVRERVFARNVSLYTDRSDPQQRVTSLQMLDAEAQFSLPSDRCDRGRLDLTATWPACQEDGTNDGRLSIGGTFAPCFRSGKSIPQAARITGRLPDWIDVESRSREGWACLAAFASAAASGGALGYSYWWAVPPTPGSVVLLGAIAAGTALASTYSTDCNGYLDDQRNINKVVPITDIAGNPLADGIASSRIEGLRVNGFAGSIPSREDAVAITPLNDEYYGPPNRQGTLSVDPVRVCRRRIMMRWQYQNRARVRLRCWLPPAPGVFPPVGRWINCGAHPNPYYEDQHESWVWAPTSPELTVEADEPCAVSLASYRQALDAAADDDERQYIASRFGERVHPHGALTVSELRAYERQLVQSYASCVESGCVFGSGTYESSGQLSTVADGVRYCPSPEPPPPPPPPEEPPPPPGEEPPPEG